MIFVKRGMYDLILGLDIKKNGLYYKRELI